MMNKLIHYILLVTALYAHSTPENEFEKRMLSVLADCCTFDTIRVQHIQDVLKLTPTENIRPDRLPLFLAYPNLANLAYVALGDLWTPITRCTQLATNLNIKNLYVKRDDLTGKSKGAIKLFGGNKVRKLEFLLGDALAHSAKTVMTFGCAGSNHALATAVYCNQLGLECLCMLKKQWNSQTVRRNLLLHLDTGSKLFHAPSYELRKDFALYHFIKTKQKTTRVPYIIPTGGSCPIGVIGFVNAAFELKEQIQQGLIPEPDRIYVPTGSCGTAAGILVGLRATGLKSKLIAVAVEPEEYHGQFAYNILTLATKTNEYLHTIDQNFPLFLFSGSSFDVELDCAGTDYALFTTQGMEARNLARIEGISLDGVYTAKGFSGLIKHARESKIMPDEIVLFWNTYCSDNFNDIASKQNYKKLPKPFHCYFKEPVQELDQ